MATTISNHAREAWQTIAPPAQGKHGPLPAMLLAMTFVTGVVDAFSYLALGRVFVANMTGNVVFLAFGLAGAAGFAAWASITSLLTFACGAALGGRILRIHDGHRGKQLRTALATQAVLMIVAGVVAWTFPHPYHTGIVATLIALVSAAMGLQNALARGLAVPDLTTTVLTLTITGVFGDSRVGTGSGSRAGRRGMSIATMIAGAVVGGVLVIHDLAPWAVTVAAVCVVSLAFVSRRLARSTSDWVTAGR